MHASMFKCAEHAPWWRKGARMGEFVPATTQRKQSLGKVLKYLSRYAHVVSAYSSTYVHTAPSTYGMGISMLF